MYALKEISTGYWLTPTDTFISEDPNTWPTEEWPDIIEAETEVALEPKRDAINAVTPGRVVVGNSPRPHR